jgi:hypothetical protein
MMKLKEAVRQFWLNVDAFAYAMDYDQLTDLRMRIERLERLTAQLTSAAVTLNERPES